jgi:hypothetical protein
VLAVYFWEKYFPIGRRNVLYYEKVQNLGETQDGNKKDFKNG